MTQDGAATAHEDKVAATADGERLVEHSTFTDGDRDLREVQDEAEVNRVAAFKETGYVAAPGVGDYHAARRNAKHNVAAVGGVADDPSAGVVDQVREAAGVARDEAAQARQANRSAGPQGRQSRHDAMRGGPAGHPAASGGQTTGSPADPGHPSDGEGTDTGAGDADTGGGADDSGTGSTPATPTGSTPKPAKRAAASTKAGN